MGSKKGRPPDSVHVLGSGAFAVERGEKTEKDRRAKRDRSCEARTLFHVAFNLDEKGRAVALLRALEG